MPKKRFSAEQIVTLDATTDPSTSNFILETYLVLDQKPLSWARPMRR
jgi:hypothetical protein